MSPQPLRDKTICITGTLSVTRDQFAALIEAAGGTVVSGITRCTDILVVGADPGEAKLDKARDLGVVVWDETRARAVMGGAQGVYMVKVYGQSDDLVEIDGAVSDELEGGDEDTFIRFTNGTYVAIHYGDEGIWRAKVIDAGKGKVSKLFGMPDHAGEENPQAHGDPDAPTYSDVLLIESEEPIELESWGRKPLPAPRVGLKTAKAIIDMLCGRGGFDDYWADIEQDDKTEVLEAIAEIVEGGK